MQFRVYWLAVRLNMGYAFLAADTTGPAALDLRMRQRAALETALQLLQGTFYDYALRCRLSRAAALLGDLPAARAWLAGCDLYPASVDLDGEIRLALAALYKLEGNPAGIIEVLGAAGAEVPIAAEAEQTYADAYRIHAYELLGHQETWERLIDAAAAKHTAPTLRGAIETCSIAPRAKQQMETRGQRRTLLLLGLIFGLPFLLAIIVAIVVVVATALSGGL